jgi:hypothetical protein
MNTFNLLFYILLLLSLVSSHAQDLTRKMYVLNGLARTLSSVNLETGEVENDIITTGNVPNRLQARSGKIYVVNSVPPGIQIIDSENNQNIRSINLPEGSNPWDMAFAGANKLYVTTLVANEVAVIDLDSGELLDPIKVGEGPQGMLIVDNTAYVSNTGGYPDYSPSTISIIDIRSDSVTKTLSVPPNPQDFALSPDGKIHVVCTGNFADAEGVVAVIDPFGDTDYTPAVVDTVHIGGYPGDISINLDMTGLLSDFGDASNGFLYSYDANTGQVIHGAADPIRIGRGAMQLLYDRNTEQLFVANFGDDTIEELDPNGLEVICTFAVGDGPQAMVIIESASENNSWADSVVAFFPGEGAGFGQNFFPDNVLGPPDPDPTLDIYNASNKPQEILSLGHGGEIILEFTDEYILDGHGPDFAVYENVFISLFDNQPFIEAAYVSVSTNGQDWVTFSWDTTTFSGFAGLTPTPLGGDQFDLADVDLQYARFVKITDIGDLKKEGLYNGDFDLDAIVVLNGPTAIPQEEPNQPLSFILEQNYPNPFNPSTTIRFKLDSPSHVKLRIFDTTGQLVQTLYNRFLDTGAHEINWDGRDKMGYEVASGLYFYRLQTARQQQTKKMILIQ